MTTTIQKLPEEEDLTKPVFSPTDFAVAVNQTLEYAYSSVLLAGEVASFKVNQGKWVFFDIKDEETSIPCFMSVYQLRVPLEDGMKVVVRGVPKLTKWGKFSFTVSAVKPVGEGSIKKAFELLKAKLLKEGLFDSAKKRPLPEDLTKLGVISSTQAAGYADFIKILNARWGGIKVQVAHTQVQGMDAPDQIIKALNYFNERGEVQVIAILRGGGSADDLSCFNDEALVRAIAASKIPVITGIGHEVDESLADLAADVVASTPSNAAEMLTLDRENVLYAVNMAVDRFGTIAVNRIIEEKNKIGEKIKQISNVVNMKLVEYRKVLSNKIKMLEMANPEKVLRQGYAILSGKVSPGNVVKITTFDKEINAEVKEIHDRAK
ncbi:exodeoxyribonuclease VII large subunit [Candidatus Saccharibacteria bacterium]|nr:exodeoxyribonuclease VII large subunit [Candidatus Saccharibacteria bacterium]